jgi:thiamine biosynthesis lipoprotein ApbE
MANSSNIDTLVRLGVLEKLLDRLVIKVEQLESLMKQQSELMRAVDTGGEWDAMPNLNGKDDKDDIKMMVD